jgi:hypothetical protein
MGAAAGLAVIAVEVGDPVEGWEEREMEGGEEDLMEEGEEEEEDSAEAD